MPRRAGSFFVFGLALAAAVVAPRARAATDVATYAYDLQRTGQNPQETVIGAGNAGGLALRWSTNLGGPVTTQPLVATNGATAGGTRDLVYVATRNGGLGVVAVDRATGAVVWHNALGAHRARSTRSCTPSTPRPGRRSGTAVAK